jgi:8-oxo-dGTP pyrophosphatase MutT (NUDIX family)
VSTGGPDAEAERHGDADNKQPDDDTALPSARPEPWKRLASEQLADCRVFRVRRDLSVDPRDGREHDFYCIEAPDWVNVIPLTVNEEVVMIEQYRHGTGEVGLEIPGGMIDEGESARDAAARELLEETGYLAPEAIALGKARPNPAIQQNWLHIFLAPGARYHRPPQFDGTEHTVVRLIPLRDVPALIADGTINHALVVVAFYRLWLYQQQYRLGKGQG